MCTRLLFTTHHHLSHPTGSPVYARAPNINVDCQGITLSEPSANSARNLHTCKELCDNDPNCGAFVYGELVIPTSRWAAPLSTPTHTSLHFHGCYYDYPCKHETDKANGIINQQNTSPIRCLQQHDIFETRYARENAISKDAVPVAEGLAVASGPTRLCKMGAFTLPCNTAT